MSQLADLSGPSPVAPLSCAVVICAYTFERWDATLEAVNSVRAQQPAPDEVILVVDHNEELRAAFADSLPGVRVVANHNDRGVSGARNAGVELTTSEVVAFLDDDAAAEPGWLAVLLPHYADPDVLGVGSRIEPRWATRRPVWFPPEFDWVVGCSYTGQATGVVRNLIGASSSYRRKTFSGGGFVDGIGRSAGIRIPVGCEETEFCIRAGEKWPTGVFIHDDRATVIHRVTPARERFSYFLKRCYSEGLSKAQMTGRTGKRDGLSAEWRYSAVTLPAGVLRGLGEAVRGELAGLLTAASIIIGLAVTTGGYGVGSASRRWQQLRASRSTASAPPVGLPRHLSVSPADTSARSPDPEHEGN